MTYRAKSNYTTKTRPYQDLIRTFVAELRRIKQETALNEAIAENPSNPAPTIAFADSRLLVLEVEGQLLEKLMRRLDIQFDVEAVVLGRKVLGDFAG